MAVEPAADLGPSRGPWVQLAQVRQAFADEVRVQACDLALMTYATEALNMVAHGLSVAPDDEILTADHEYSEVQKTLAFAAKTRGAKVVVAEMPLPVTDAGAFADALLATDGLRPKILFLGLTSSTTV